MVKNKVGGNKAKKYGRKHMLGDNQAVKVRFAKEEGEMYAIVIKHFGQGRMDVLCEDDKIRSCIIRKKFRGRHRHNNKASVGYFIMVGIREWEMTSKSKETCDLLETYDDQEKDRLMQCQSKVPFQYMLKRCNDLCGINDSPLQENDNMIQFTNNDEEDQDSEEDQDFTQNNNVQVNSDINIDGIDFDEI